jgi:hypothetical protein
MALVFFLYISPYNCATLLTTSRYYVLYFGPASDRTFRVREAETDGLKHPAGQQHFSVLHRDLKYYKSNINKLLRQGLLSKTPGPKNGPFKPLGLTGTHTEFRT